MTSFDQSDMRTGVEAFVYIQVQAGSGKFRPLSSLFLSGISDPYMSLTKCLSLEDVALHESVNEVVPSI